MAHLCALTAARGARTQVVALPARHDRGDHRADLSVLALRPAGTAGAARIPRGRCGGRGRPHRRGRPARLRHAAADLAQARRRCRRSRRMRGDRRALAEADAGASCRPSPFGRAAISGSPAAPHAGRFVDPPALRWPETGSRAIATTTIASRRSRRARAPRSRLRAAVPIPAASAPSSISAITIAGAGSAPLLEEIDGLIAQGVALRLLH